MNLTEKNSLLEQHSWLIGISMKPLVNEPGFDSSGYLQMNITFS
jgi:hypothetical protein